MATGKKRADSALRVNTQPKFELSPYLYMQFMEPLGASDSSVEAGWDFNTMTWRDDLLDATRELGATLIRWPGGTLTAYYRWKEAVGPRDKRRPLVNITWDGVESNQVGTHEFVDFCRLVGADPLMVVNFESDGVERWGKLANGEIRTAGPEEAAEWVDYCNNPLNALRRQNGAMAPFNVKLWQIGNETSYDPLGYHVDIAAERTVVFAKAMRAVDPSLKLIGWGDSGWAPRMCEIAGEHLQYVAFHHHFDSGVKPSVLRSGEYYKDPAATWEHLMNAYKSTERRISEVRDEVKGYDVGLALTESHFGLAGRNRCEVLATWGAGVANARILNTHARNGDVLKIATLADFCGTRWLVNAIMIPVPRHHRRKCYLMPVARVMSLFRHHSGTHAVDVAAAPEELDVTASRKGDTYYLHVVNTHRTNSVEVDLAVDSRVFKAGRAYQIVDDPMREIHDGEPDLFRPTKHDVPAGGQWTFPPASVTALEIDVEA